MDLGCRKDAVIVTDVIGVSAIGECGNVKSARSLIKGEYRIDPNSSVIIVGRPRIVTQPPTVHLGSGSESTRTTVILRLLPYPTAPRPAPLSLLHQGSRVTRVMRPGMLYLSSVE